MLRRRRSPRHMSNCRAPASGHRPQKLLSGTLHQPRPSFRCRATASMVRHPRQISKPPCSSFIRLHQPRRRPPGIRADAAAAHGDGGNRAAIPARSSASVSNNQLLITTPTAVDLEVSPADRARMLGSTSALANAADFTLFMVGAWWTWFCHWSRMVAAVDGVRAVPFGPGDSLPAGVQR